ncbi:hypothetical protein COX05_01430 [candidate division WWE3 bacterium CG22_combo_CG10-13_8_21_14_all_39_12]|uniref:Uncharacterized protein n=1 Tax=candidate division WWE3 bacterium CG22_combo_CG10-13_8_21_14_all_39_12 TaxID=1975094 RepID=A0A2H0BGE9_UNCKA|nr:MAG: hypothetical protein COX05_01430 [candidate division WWE3 bacterium CG22_combo_CG10-13_8_21_14_all_39_12]
MNQHILDYILEQKQSSFSDSQIVSALVSAGWNKDEVNKALESINGGSSPEPMASKSSKSRAKLIISVLVAIIITGAGVVGLFAFGTLPENNEQLPVGTLHDVNPIIAYVESYPDDFAGNIVFYDTQKQEKLPTDLVIEADANTLFQLGPWSPDGKYLPILGFYAPGEEGGIVNLYLFDSKTRLAKRIYSDLRGEDNFLWANPSFSFLSGWIDNDILVVSSNRSGLSAETSQLTYFTTYGEIGTKVEPYVYLQKSSQLTHSVKSEVDTQIQTITLIDRELSFYPEGEIVGVVENKLVVLKKPEEIDLGFDFDGGTGGSQEWEDLELQINELAKQGVPQEDLDKMIRDFLEPQGETVLNLYNLETGEIDKVVALTDGPWQTQSVLVREEEPFLIAHQTDSAFLPTKERYVAIYVSDPYRVEMLYEGDLLQQSNHNFFNSLLTHGSSFGLSNEGNWIIGERGSRVDDPKNSSIFMLNIFTGEEVIVCSGYCSGVKVYNPLALENRY